MNPVLYERLQTISDDETVEVAIWVVEAVKRSEAEIFAELGAKFSEVQEALDRSGDPLDVHVDDSERLNEIERAYTELMVRDVPAQTQPLVSALEAQGYKAKAFGGTPAVIATLPKKAILEIAQRTDVGVIYSIEEKETPEMDSAASSDEAPRVWAAGFEGNGEIIGILEQGLVDFTGSATGGGNYLISQGTTRSCSESESWHKTHVASVAASSYSGYKGIASQASIIDACTTGTEGDDVDALEWVIGTNADPINASIGFYYDGQLNFIDKAFDYWARYGLDTITKSAGNSASDCYISSPGVAWNVITVGAYDDHSNATWTGDNIWSNSCRKNPIGTDREKPEVAAPGVAITALELNSNPVARDGTSYAAAQVTGIAALLMDRNMNLRSYPNSLKAIIMASAVHNIEGDSRLSDYDGAGGVDAFVADTIAKTMKLATDTTVCDVSCWWYKYITPSTFPQGTYFWRSFNANAGDKVRVAISWFSNASCPDASNCLFDELDTNLNLYVFRPDDTLIASSVTVDNNYEIVEFTATQTGVYDIGVYRQGLDPNGEQSNYLGIAWTTVPKIAGIYDDPPSGPVTYAGTWTSSSGWSRSYLNTISYSNVINDKTVFTFTGDSLTRVYTMAVNRGVANIYIDGVAQPSLNDSSSYTRWQVAKTWSVPFGTHTIEVKNNGGGYIDLDAFIVDIPFVYPGTYDNTDAFYKFIGTWAHSSPWPSAYNSTLSWSKTTEDAVTFTFEGNSITYVYTKASNRGKALITIDGVPKELLDLYSASPVWQASKTYSNLGTGIHTIHISVSGQKNGSSSDYYVDVDALIVP